MIVTTPRLGESISGAILYDETIRQQTLAGVPFAQALEAADIVPGIKVDAGAKDLAAHPDELVTEGLDGLRERLAEYASMGARFAKWRAVITIGTGIPSRGCTMANAHSLARYAGLCQEAGLVPIVEPEVLMDGDHDLTRCADVTAKTLQAVFCALNEQRVLLEGMLLKPNMAQPREPALARPRPLRAIGWPWLGAALQPAARHRLRPVARRPRSVSPMGQQGAGPSRAWPHGRRRGDDRTARPGAGQCGRHGDRRGASRGALQPRRARDRRPPHVGDRQRR